MVSSLSDSPGVYWFLDKKRTVLYIGKAKNLQKRLKSYRDLGQASSRLGRLIQQTNFTRFQPTISEISALLLEAQLIRLHQPPYNIRLKDDKSNLYIIITDETFPRVLTVRKNCLNHSLYQIRATFGPFLSSRQTREILKIGRRLFPFCTGTEAQKRRLEPCFYYHVHLCPGACIGALSEAGYLKFIHRLTLFLTGRHSELVKLLTRLLKQAVKDKRFETANMLKQQLISLVTLTHAYQIRQDYDLPELSGNRGPDRLIALKHLLAPYVRLTVENRLDRIEAYDVANLQGTYATASMVVFSQGLPDPSQYRHFRIRQANIPNDSGMLKETLTRRLKHPEWSPPDLIVIDGGTPQLKALSNLLPRHIPILGLAKNPDRLVISSGSSLKGRSYTLPLPKSNSGSLLLQHLRDEAHRYARRLHHKLHLKSYQP